MKRYVTSVEVEAVQWTGEDSSYQEILELLNHTSERKISPFSPSLKTLFIEIDKKYSLTLSLGGYLIRGVTGQYFIMSEEEFNEYYKPIESKDEKKESNKNKIIALVRVVTSVKGLSDLYAFIKAFDVNDYFILPICRVKKDLWTISYMARDKNTGKVGCTSIELKEGSYLAKMEDGRFIFID